MTWRSRRRKSDSLQTKNCPHHHTRVSLNSAEYGTLIKRLLLRLTTTSNAQPTLSRCSLPLVQRGGRADANASHGPANRPSGGGNCPRIPLTIPRPNCQVMSPNCTSTCSLAGVHVGVNRSRYCASHTENSFSALTRKTPLQSTNLLRPYLRILTDERLMQSGCPMKGSPGLLRHWSCMVVGEAFWRCACLLP